MALELKQQQYNYVSTICNWKNFTTYYAL